MNWAVLGAGAVPEKRRHTHVITRWVRRMQTRIGGDSNHTSVYRFGNVHHLSGSGLGGAEVLRGVGGREAAGLRVRAKGATL